MPRISSSRQRTASGQQQQLGIQTFARTTKAGLRSSRQSIEDGKKEGLLVESGAPSSKCQLSASPSKKRKLSELENVGSFLEQRGRRGDKDGSGVTTGEVTTLTPSKSLKFSSLSVSTPRSGHYASNTRSTTKALVEEDAEEEEQHRCKGDNGYDDDDNDSTPSTPSKRATARTRVRLDSRLQKSNGNTKNQAAAVVLRAERPACVEDLVGLHLSFLKAITIHAAHNGVASPADLREFLHSVQRLWKKRKVVVKDLQRLIWIWQQHSSEAASMFGYRLANYGLGRVCLERVTRGLARTDEVVLQTQFEQAVDLLWEKTLDAVDGDETRVDFIASLGLAPIHDSLTPFTAFRKGQQRLQDLRGGVIKMKMEHFRAETVNNSSTTPKPARDAATTRRQGLLDRLKNKQLRQSKLPPPPSKEMLLRRSAAERIEEVAGVVAMLRPVGYVGSGPTARMAVQRTPFCLETIVRNVQDSSRNPISDKEVEICLEILSREDVAGHWVNLVTVSQLKSVVLKSCGDVQPKEIAAKVSQLKIGWEEPALASLESSN